MFLGVEGRFRVVLCVKTVWDLTPYKCKSHNEIYLHSVQISYILKQTWWCLSVWTKIGQWLEDSSSHCTFPVELVTNRAGQGRAARAAAAGGRARCHFY